MEEKLLTGFSGEEKERVKIHLQKLLPYLRKGGFTIVGGLAIRYHLISKGISYSPGPFNDLDIIVENSEVVSQAVAQDFLIYHYHPDDFYLALVEPITKTKVDVFEASPVPHKTVTVNFGEETLRVVSIEDQLVKTVFDIQRISEEKKVDPKQFFDTRLLMQIADLKLANQFWQQNQFHDFPSDLMEAVNRAENIAKSHPNWLQEKPFTRAHPYKCPDCQNTDGFTVAPMEQVYKVLGYVE